MSFLSAVQTVLRYAEAGVKLGSQMVAELQGKKSVNEEVKESEPVASKMTNEDFADKVDYEGGIFEALSYGLRATDLKNQDGELAKKWATLEERWNDLRPLVDEIQMLLDDSWGTGE